MVRTEDATNQLPKRYGHVMRLGLTGDGKSASQIAFQLCSSPARIRLWILKRVWQLYSVKHKRGALSDARETATCRYRGSVIWRQIGTVSAVANLSEWHETEFPLAASLAFLSTQQRGKD